MMTNNSGSKRFIAVMILLMMGSLSGCGNSPKTKELLDVYENNGEEQKTKGVLETREDGNENSIQNNFGLKGDGVPSHVSCILNKNGEFSLDINADVDTTGCGDAKVYQTKAEIMTEDELIAFADSFFDQGQYTRQLPYKYWKKEDLEKEEEKLLSQLDEDKPGYGIHYTLQQKLRSVLESAAPEWDGNAADLEYGKILYRDVKEIEDIDLVVDSDTYNGLDEDEMELFAVLRGKVNGKEYILDYRCGDGEDNVYQELEILPLFPVSMQGYMYDTTGLGENTCNKEQMKQKATEIINSLTDDFVYGVATNRIAVIGETAQGFYDGINLHYVRKIDEQPASLSDFVYYANEIEEIIKSHVTKQDVIDVEMNEEGDLVYLIYDSNTGLAEEEKQDTQLLPFTSVLKAADDYLSQQTKETMEDSLCSGIGEIKLDYMEVIYDNRIMYMPYWIFVSDEAIASDDNFYSIAVNAVDGTVSGIRSYR